MLQYTNTINISQYLSNPLNQAKTYILTFMSDPIGFVRNNITLIAGSFTLLGIGYGAVSGLVNKVKKQAEVTVQQAQAETTQISTDYLKLDQQKQEVDKLLETKTSELNVLQEAQTKYQSTITKLENEVEKAKKEIVRLDNIVSYIDGRTVLQSTEKQLVP
jgi:hypothetical protein